MYPSDNNQKDGYIYIIPRFSKKVKYFLPFLNKNNRAGFRLLLTAAVYHNNSAGRSISAPALDWMPAQTIKRWYSFN
jgi:hypothetical protein